MKKLLLICIPFLCIKVAYSQDSAKIKSIDVYVASINDSDFRQFIDSSIMELPAGKPFKKTHVTLFYKDSANLYKAVTVVTMFPNPAYGMMDAAITKSIIYYKDNKMVKAEESMKEGNRQSPVLSSYFDNGLVYTSIASNGSRPDRTPILKQLAESYLNEFLKLKLK